MKNAFYGCAVLAVALFPVGARAQTVQGDILRGKGAYLNGAGWYNFNTARADRINVETWKSYNREVQRLYRDYMNERNTHIQSRRGMTNKVQAEIQRKFEADQRRWREDPTPADIASGDALNALASDLADPSIGPSSWRTAEIGLPPGTNLTTLAFKIADPKKSRLQQSTVAVDRMLIKDDWPLPFRRPEIGRECSAYQKAIAAVVDKCRKGTQLQAADYERLRDSVTTLQKAVETAVPPRDNQRSQAKEYVRRLDEATRIFAEQAYAEQLIRDVSEHQATSVAALLAFMREYRLMFSDPGSSPEVTSLYDNLYGLLRQQKDALGIRTAPAASALFQAGTMWVGAEARNAAMKFRVVERNGGQFKATFTQGKDGAIVREITGSVGDDSISWTPAGVRVIKMPPQAMAKQQNKGRGVDNNGVFKGNEIHFTFSGNGQQPGAFVLRKAP